MIKTNDLAQTARVSIVSPEKIFWTIITNKTEIFKRANQKQAALKFSI